MRDLSVVQKTYDLIKWYVPILNKLPRDHKLLLGNLIIKDLYNLLDQLIMAQYAKKKLSYLEPLNGRLQVMRHQTRLLLDFELISRQRYQYASQLINGIGQELGGWIKSQQGKEGKR
ncbi:MAG: diversity-generating retroelement protein Avd [Microcystaceae cyanobacterium]